MKRPKNKEHSNDRRQARPQRPWSVMYPGSNIPDRSSSEDLASETTAAAEMAEPARQRQEGCFHQHQICPRLSDHPGWAPSLWSQPDAGFLGHLKDKTLTQEAATGSWGHQNQSARKKSQRGPDRTQLLAHGRCGDISGASHRTPGLKGLEQRSFCPPASASGRASPPLPGCLRIPGDLPRPL